MQTQCKHLYCAQCLIAWFKITDTCPYDRRVLFEAESASTTQPMTLPNEGLLQAMTWPQGLEPFTIADTEDEKSPFATDADLEVVDDRILAIRAAVVHLTKHFDDWFRVGTGENEYLHDHDADSPVDTDPTILRQIALAGCQRLASSPGHHPVMHAMCRYEWTRIYRRISKLLEHKEIRPAKVSVLKNVLVSLLKPFKYDRGLTTRSPGIVLNREVRRFGEDVRVLIRWIASTAANQRMQLTAEVPAGLAQQMLILASKIHP